MVSPDNDPSPMHAPQLDAQINAAPVPRGALDKPQAGDACAAVSAGAPARAPSAAAANNNGPALLGEDLEDAPFWKEVVAFARMPAPELEPYQGKFVAVYQGSIVDSDQDEAELALRFYRVFGYVPVYIHEVGVEDDVIDVLD